MESVMFEHVILFRFSMRFSSYYVITSSFVPVLFQYFAVVCCACYMMQLSKSLTISAYAT